MKLVIVGGVIQGVTGDARCDTDAKIHSAALQAGCDPLWYDGTIGLAWHCTCEDNRHGYDSQCSVITLESLARK